MEINPTDAPLEREPAAYPPPQPNVRTVLVVQTLLCLLGAGIFALIAGAAGWDTATTLTPESPIAMRWQARWEIGLGHFLVFLAAGFLTVWLFYRSITGIRPDWRDYLRVRRSPNPLTVGLTVLLMAASIPLVLFLLNLNQLVPFPDGFETARQQTETMLKGLLRMDSLAELWANLFIIALLPALGEEIVFRGVVQQQLMRRIANPWSALTISAAVFSFFHFQFDGFLPRLLLGFLLGWLYWETRNFWVPAIAHFFNNGLQVVGQYLYSKEVSTIDWEQDIQVPWFFALVSLFMVIVVMRLIRQTKEADPYSGSNFKSPPE